MIYLLLSNLLNLYSLIGEHMKKVNRILDSMISDIDKVKLGLYEASTKRKK